MFYGYRDELDYIVSKLASPNNSMSFTVMGGRMIGKTSLLRQVERLLKEFNTIPPSERDQQMVIPLYLDMLLLDDPIPGNFVGKVGYLLNRSFVKSSLPFDIPSSVSTLLQSVQTNPEPLDTFVDTIYELIEAAYPTKLRIVLLIDDLWRVKRQEKNKSLTGMLRALLIEPTLDKAIACIIAGSYQEIDPNKPGSPLDNLLRMVDLHSFDVEQSLALINEPTQGKVPQEVARAVHVESGGHPFLLQFLMSELCEHTDWTQLTIENVYNATLRFRWMRKDFERWWEKLSPTDKRVYEVFCQQRQASPDDLHRMMLNILAGGGRNVILNKPRILDSLRILRTMGLIREREDGELDAIYELAGQWYARWFRQMNRELPAQSLIN
jgi:hypothetical protein